MRVFSQQSPLHVCYAVLISHKQLSTVRFGKVLSVSRLFLAKITFSLCDPALHRFKVMWFRTHLVLKLLCQFGSSKEMFLTFLNRV